MGLNVKWVTQQSILNKDELQLFPKTVLDSQGNIYITTSETSDMGDQDIVIFKIDRNGTLQSKFKPPILQTIYNDTVPHIAIDNGDNIYITYQTTGTISSQTHLGSGNDIVVVKMDTTLDQVHWVSQNPIFNTIYDDVTPTIDVDSMGYIYVSYISRNGNLNENENENIYNIVVFKLQPQNGNCIWINQHPTINYDILCYDPKIAVDSAGNICCAYQSKGIKSAGGADIIVFKLSPIDGSCIWSVNRGTTKYDHGCMITIDKKDLSIYLSYYTENNMVILKLEPDNGQCVWIKHLPITTMSDSSPNMSVSINGYIYIAYETNHENNQTCDMIFLKLDPNEGKLIWSRELPIFNTNNNNINPFIMIDTGDDLYLTYHIIQSTGEGDGEGVSNITTMRLLQPSPQISFVKQNTTQTDDYYGVIVVDPPNVPIVGSYVEFYFNVENIGDVPVYNITINDNLGTDSLVIGDLQPSQKINTSSKVYQLTQSDFELGNVYAQATAEGEFFDQNASCYGQCSVKVTQISQLNVIKTTTHADTFVNGFIDYNIKVHNNGNVSFHNLQITDTFDDIKYIYERLTLNVGDTWEEKRVRVTISDKIYQQYMETGYVTNLAVVTGTDALGHVHTFDSNLNHAVLCLMKDAMVLLADGTSKPIQDVQRGDIVSTGHKVSRLCIIEQGTYVLVEMIHFRPGCLGCGIPNNDLIVTGNHPIIFAGARRPAKCFEHMTGVSRILQSDIGRLYDLQFDCDGTYIANNIEVQSCSPRSASNPLPKELYYNPELFTGELVWDNYEQNKPLITDKIQPRAPKKLTFIQRHKQFRKKMEN